MNLLHRYLFRSVFFASLASVILFVLLLMAGNVLKEILGLISSGLLDWGQSWQLISLLVPYVFSFALPIGILCGVLIVLGKLSAQREIIAVKSAGISLWTLSAPVIAVAIIGTAAAFFINNFYGPSARAQYKIIIAESLRHDPLSFITPKTFINEFPGYVIYVREKNGANLSNFWIWELDDQKRALRLLRAEEGKFDYERENDALILTLKNATAEIRSNSNPDDLHRVRPIASLGDLVVRLPLANILGERTKKKKLSNMSLIELMDVKAKASKDLLSLPPEADPKERNEIAQQLEKSRMIIQKNTAMAFSVFSLALVGIPIGIRIRRRELYANLALALALAMTYYFSMMVMSWLESMPHVRPDLLVWVPNLVFQTAGIIMLYRANKH